MLGKDTARLRCTSSAGERTVHTCALGFVSSGDLVYRHHGACHAITLDLRKAHHAHHQKTRRRELSGPEQEDTRWGASARRGMSSHVPLLARVDVHVEQRRATAGTSRGSLCAYKIPEHVGPLLCFSPVHPTPLVLLINPLYSPCPAPQPQPTKSSPTDTRNSWVRRKTEHRNIGTQDDGETPGLR